MEDNVLTTISGAIADPVKGKVQEFFRDVKGHYSDTVLKKTIHQNILKKYENEPFYDDLDAYLTRYNIIENLILIIRKSENISEGSTEFKESNCENFLRDHPEYLGYKQEILGALDEIYRIALSSITDIDPYSDLGKVRSVICQGNAETTNAINTMSREIARVNISLAALQTLQLGPAPVISQELSAKAEDFKSRIKEVVNTFQKKGLYEEALEQYVKILMFIVEAELHGNLKDELLCSLRCNMAICHSNLGNVKKAIELLDEVPEKIATGNAEHNYVWAAIVVQHHCNDKYPDAFTRVSTSLRLRKDHHSAFFLEKFLRSCLGLGAKQTLLQELDEYFNGIQDKNEKNAHTVEFYNTAGNICAVFDDPWSAYNYYEKALEYDKDNISLRYNHLFALYRQAIADLPNKTRLLHPNVDIQKLYLIYDGLRELIHDPRSEEKQNAEVLTWAVNLYLSTSCVLFGRHDLKPIRKYLQLTRDYEGKRMLILGSKEPIDDEVVSELVDEDTFVLKLMQLFDNGKYIECKEKIIERIHGSEEKLPISASHILLQLCLMEKDGTQYKKYRNSKQLSLQQDMSIEAMDACTDELDGRIIDAKKRFDIIAESCNDFQLLDNALRFYKRNKFDAECEKLYLMIQVMQKERKIVVEDLDSFYTVGLDYMVSRKMSSAEQFYENAPQELSQKARSFMGVRLFLELHNPSRLLNVLPYYEWSEYENAINKALCLRDLCRYDDALVECFEYLKAISSEKQEEEKEKRANIFWLISDLYLFKQDMDKSYEWAIKAHELVIKLPYDAIHNALVGRSMRTGHFEGLNLVLNYQKMHPAAIKNIKAFHIPVGEEDASKVLLEELAKMLPNTSDTEDTQKLFEQLYKQKPMPIRLLLKAYGGDWTKLIMYAQKKKLRLGLGNEERRNLEERWVGRDLVVDSQTIILSALFECLPAFSCADRVHVACSSVDELQKEYLANQHNVKAINIAMEWLNTAANIVIEQDGFLPIDNNLLEAFSPGFFAACNVAERLDAAFLCADTLIPRLQVMDNFPAKTIKFVTLPSVCGLYKKAQQDAGERMIYRLLQFGEFIPFSASTMLTVIRDNKYKISEDQLAPFLICRTDYDMSSFLSVYFRAIMTLKGESEDAAKDLNELILIDAKRIWKRGSHYREWARKNPDSKKMNEGARVISAYVFSVLDSTKSTWSQIPPQLVKHVNDLYKEIDRFYDFLTRRKS